MQRVLHGIEKWCDERQLSVNPSKTELILFTRKLKIEGFQSITFYGKTLALSNFEMTYIVSGGALNSTHSFI